MLSVTQRVRRISQPDGGYLPGDLFTVREYYDGKNLNDGDESSSAFSWIQGTVVDYLTRMMCGVPVERAFQISLLGAETVDELGKALLLTKSINGLDQTSIRKACKLVGYDVAYRRSFIQYTEIDEADVPNYVIENIVILVERGVTFIKKHAPLLLTGFTFEDGYTSLVSAGDGDFLTYDGLWDFKVSNRDISSRDTLQILTYYILGIHSIHKEFSSITTIGIFNPIQNASYEISISDIPNETYQLVSRNVIGYKVAEDPVLWREIEGEDEEVIDSFCRFYYPERYYTGFNPDKYEDGIHEINKDDYWTYFHDKSEGVRPSLIFTEKIMFLKHGGFIMFVSVSRTGHRCILHGGQIRSLDKPIEYYYERLPEYGRKVQESFQKYWEALYGISEELRQIGSVYDEHNKQERKTLIGTLSDNAHEKAQFLIESKCLNENRVSGKVHGCIVDIDWFNHIYLNPFDGSIVPYHAESICSKRVFYNTKALITRYRPDILPGFKKKFIEQKTYMLHDNSKTKHAELMVSHSGESSESMIVYDTDIYAVSRRMKQFQLIHDYNLVTIWYDQILPEYIIKEPDTYTNTSAKALIGLSVTLTDGNTVKAISAEGGYLTIQYFDGTTKNHISVKQFLSGKINKESVITVDEDCVGRKRRMRNGLVATIIDFRNRSDIDVRFEDGAIVHGVSNNAFYSGRVEHPENRINSEYILRREHEKQKKLKADQAFYQYRIKQESGGTIETSDYLGRREEVTARCKKCNYVWQIEAGALLMRCYCPKCDNRRHI